ncbi:ribonuclease YeeF family protein [Oceanobacillus halophilus]|uniref:ribonuclease YeeF family protein n=1 Tax=Oceanobacillus halophilus TaxID=930130 RepID=UPI0013144201|nr:T7SS effector LXG polymorphic toxin [Oceanobacillus halophilus]
MKVLDVGSLQRGIEQATADIDLFYEQISAIQRAVRDFHGLDDALKGEGGEAIRAFYLECHQPFLIFLYQSLVNYQNILSGMKEAIHSYESDSSGFVSQEFIQSNVTEGLRRIENKTLELTGEANSIIASVQDLVSVRQVNESEVIGNIQRGKEKSQDTVEELNALDHYETSLLEETLTDLHTMKNYVADLESKFQDGNLSVENFNVAAIQGMDSYGSLIDGIYHSNHNNGVTLSETSIETMPLYAIEKAKNQSIEELSDESQVILNHAYQDLVNGNIDRSDYYTIFSSLEKMNGNVTAEELEEDVPEGFMDYLKDNNEKIGRDLGVNLFSATLEQVGVGTMKLGGMINVLTGTPGPSGANSFVMVNQRTSRISNAFIENGKTVNTAGKVLGRGFMAAGFGIGMYQDIAQKDKTVGEAVSHNTAALGVGIGGNAVGMAGTALLLGSNPAGWAVLGGIAVGTTFTVGFNYMYDNNILGLQDGLDYVGQKLDEFGNNVKETASDLVESAGEAIQSGLDAINPMNWSWG